MLGEKMCPYQDLVDLLLGDDVLLFWLGPDHLLTVEVGLWIVSPAIVGVELNGYDSLVHLPPRNFSASYLGAAESQGLYSLHEW